MPFISVVIPAFNRAREIRRTLDSCVSQRDADFEVIVVDDGSRDGSAAAVREYAGRGVRLIEHPRNLGSSPARTTGMNASRGEWIARLDSDDELLPGALAAVERHARAVPANVGRLGLMYRYEDGRISPFPPPPQEILRYEDCLAWLENSEMYDCLNVFRRSAIQEVPLPQGRLMEFLHYLDFSRKFDTLYLRDFAVLYHLDAGGRQSRDLPNEEECRQAVEEVDLIAARHGEALRRHAPEFYRGQLRRRTVFTALAGRRRDAIREGLSQLVSFPLSPLHWAALGSVILGRKPISLALDVKWRFLEWQRKRNCRPQPA